MMGAEMISGGGGTTEMAAKAICFWFPFGQPRRWLPCVVLPHTPPASLGGPDWPFQGETRPGICCCTFVTGDLLIHVYKTTMWNITMLLMGTSTITMAIFNRYFDKTRV